MQYMGSKANLVKYIKPILLRARRPGQTYVEPFVGGLNMFQAIPEPKIGSDLNPFLIAMWEDLLAGVKFPTKIPRSLYIKAREQYNTQQGDLSIGEMGWIGFMGSFNGRFFDGGYSDAHCISKQIRNILSQVQRMGKATLVHADYRALPLPPASLIYCDPPYAGTKQYGQTFDSQKFFTWAENKAKEGHTVYISEFNAPFKEVWSRPRMVGLLGNKTLKTERLYYVDVVR